GCALLVDVKAEDARNVVGEVRAAGVPWLAAAVVVDALEHGCALPGWLPVSPSLEGLPVKPGAVAACRWQRWRHVFGLGLPSPRLQSAYGAGRGVSVVLRA